jgi:hypothetical protein
MKIGEVFKDRAALTELLDPTSPRFITGSEADQKQARDEWRRNRYVAEVMRSDLEEIPRSNLKPLRYGTLEDTTTGTFYRPRRDGLTDLNDATGTVAYYVDPDGTPVLLERPNGPKTQAELEQQQAEREQRRNAPKSRPAWMNQ